MDYLEIALFVIGAGLLIFGYRKTNRDVLVAAALVLFLAGSIGDFFTGFVDGVNGSRAAAVQPTDQRWVGCISAEQRPDECVVAWA